MSVGHLCEHCGQGRVRPFQFSLDQAVVTCDNVDCESRLDISPWDCVVDRSLWQINRPTSDPGRLQLWSRSSSSSGVQSDIRSPLLSPAQSCGSVTDREVEHLLRRSYAPPPKSKSTGRKNRLSECHKLSIHSERLLDLKSNHSYSSFFELLDNLDLDTPVQQTIKRECSPMSEAVIDDTGLDAVTTELETWMEVFEFPMNTNREEKGEKKADIQQSSKLDNIETIESNSTSSHRLYIPSKGSAFSQVSPKKDNVKKISNYSSEENIGVNKVTKNCSNNSLIPIEKSFDSSKNDLSSLCDAQFLSPAASAVSDDSGYEETGNKASLVLLPPCLSNKKSDPLCPTTVLEKEKKKETLQRTPLVSPSALKKLKMNVSVRSVNELNILPAGVSSELPSHSEADESEKMDIEEVNNLPQESNNPQSCSTEQDDSKEIENISEMEIGNIPEIPLKSSQPDESVPANETEKIVSINKTSDTKSTDNDKNSRDALHEISESDQSCNQNKAKRPGRPRGRPKKLQNTGSGPSEVVEKRSTKRHKSSRKLTKQQEISNVASLRKGLATLLQAPTLHIKKEHGNRHMNLTNLSLRSRLNVRYSFSL